MELSVFEPIDNKSLKRNPINRLPGVLAWQALVEGAWRSRKGFLWMGKSCFSRRVFFHHPVFFLSFLHHPFQQAGRFAVCLLYHFDCFPSLSSYRFVFSAWRFFFVLFFGLVYLSNFLSLSPNNIFTAGLQQAESPGLFTLPGAKSFSFFSYPCSS